MLLRRSEMRLHSLSPQAMKLLADNRGKGKTEMLSDTVTCAFMLSSPCVHSARLPLRLCAARMRKGGRIGKDSQGTLEQRKE